MDACDFVELHFLLKAQHENFAIDCRNSFERVLHAGILFCLQNLIEWRFAVFISHVERGVFFGAGERIDASRFFAAMPIKNEIAGDGEKPGFKFPFAVVLVAAFEDTQPGFLEKILGAFAVGGEMQQVTEQPELVLLDQLIEQFGITALQALRKSLGVVAHEGGKAYRRGSDTGCSCSCKPDWIDGAHFNLRVCKYKPRNPATCIRARAGKRLKAAEVREIEGKDVGRGRGFSCEWQIKDLRERE